jgi:ElaB/YqjD/DUF883 family membrane-anchored ribosome-binding protein
MSELNWKSRLANGRDAAKDSVGHLSASARETAATARSRIESTYGAARERAGDLAERAQELTADGRELATAGLERGAQVAAKGRKAVDKAIFSTRDLVAERPLTAIAVGITAGIVLGFLANQLGKSRTAAVEVDEDEDDQIYGG